MIQNNNVGGSEQKKCTITLTSSNITAWDNNGNSHSGNTSFECSEGVMIAAKDRFSALNFSGEYTEVRGAGSEGLINLIVPYGDVTVSR